MKIAKVKKMVNEKERQQKILCLERKRDDRLQEEMSKNFWPQFLPNPGGYNFLEVTDTSKKEMCYL